MEKESAQKLAIEFAKEAIASGSAPFHFNEKGATDIADFIEKLTERLAAQ